MRRRLALLLMMVAVLALGVDAASAQGFGFGGFGFGGGGGGFGRGGGFGGGGFGGFGRGGGGGGFNRGGGGGGFNRGDGGGYGRGGGRVGRDGGFGRGGDAGYGRGGSRMGREGGVGRGGDGGYGGSRRQPYDTAGRPPRGSGTYPGREAGQGRRPGTYPGEGRPGGRHPYPQPYPVVKHPYPKPVIVQVPPRGPGYRPVYPRPPVVVAVPPYAPPRGAPPPVVPPPQVAGPPPVAPPPRNFVGPPPVAPPPPRAAAPQVADDGPYLPREVLITTRAQASPADLAALEQRLQLVPIATSRIELLGTDLRRYRIAGNADVPATVQALRGDPAVRAAQPNYLFETQQEPQQGSQQDPAAAQSQAESPAPPAAPPKGEPAQAAPASLGTAPVDNGKIAYAPAPDQQSPAQYAIAAMRLTDAHKIATGADVRIAIIDTGLDETHPEIAGKVVDRFDAVDGSFMAHPHGTAMAGVIVADKAMTGIAPKARLIAIRAFAGHARGARGNSNDIVRAVDFAVLHHAQIVNLSFAGPRDELLAEVLAAARERGVIEVAAAGNQGPNSKPLYPAAEPGVIAITATDAQNAPFAMANRGTYIAAAAPGVDILAPSPGGTMQLTSGTSVAAAEASGVIALLLQTRPQMGTTVVRRVLSDTAVRLPPAGGESLSLIDALAVVQTAPAIATAH